jgi:hypothetical protein
MPLPFWFSLQKTGVNDALEIISVDGIYWFFMF